MLASIGSVGDAYDNAMAESFVDTFKTELITDRVWRTRTQLELAIVEWVAWYNHDRLASPSATSRQPNLKHSAASTPERPSEHKRDPPNTVSVKPSPPQKDTSRVEERRGRGKGNRAPVGAMGRRSPRRRRGIPRGCFKALRPEPNSRSRRSGHRHAESATSRGAVSEWEGPISVPRRLLPLPCMQVPARTSLAPSPGCPR